jgi:hypothetical protein
MRPPKGKNEQKASATRPKQFRWDETTTVLNNEDHTCARYLHCTDARTFPRWQTQLKEVWCKPTEDSQESTHWVDGHLWVQEYDSRTSIEVQRSAHDALIGRVIAVPAANFSTLNQMRAARRIYLDFTRCMCAICRRLESVGAKHELRKEIEDTIKVKRWDESVPLAEVGEYLVDENYSSMVATLSTILEKHGHREDTRNDVALTGAPGLERVACLLCFLLMQDIVLSQAHPDPNLRRPSVADDRRPAVCMVRDIARGQSFQVCISDREVVNIRPV